MTQADFSAGRKVSERIRRFLMQHVIGPHTFPLFLHVDLDNLSAAGASYAGRSGSLCGLGHRLGDLRVPTVEHRYHSRVWLSSMVV